MPYCRGQEAGYTGSDVLSQDLDVSKPVAIGIAQVRPLMHDVAIGARSADMDRVDPKGDSLLDVPGIAALGGCLGDVIAAFIVDVGIYDHMVAVGIQEDKGDVTSTMCEARC